MNNTIDIEKEDSILSIDNFLEDDFINLQRNLKELISKEGASIVDLCKSIGIAHTTMYRALQEPKNVTLETLISIAKYFKVTILDLFSPTEIRNFYVPILEIERVIPFQQGILKLDFYNHKEWVSLNRDGCFALKGFPSIEPVFNRFSILIFQKILMPLENYHMHYVIIHAQNMLTPFIKKFHIDGNKFFLSSLDSLFPVRELKETEKVVGYLTEIRLEKKFF